MTEETKESGRLQLDTCRALQRLAAKEAAWQAERFEFANNQVLIWGGEIFNRQQQWTNRHPKISTIFPTTPLVAARLQMALEVLNGRDPLMRGQTLEWGWQIFKREQK